MGPLPVVLMALGSVNVPWAGQQAGDDRLWMPRSLAFIFEAGFQDKGRRLRLCFRKISLAEHRYKGAMLEARAPTGRPERRQMG